ncbi:hypothetical protein SADUNF_Sadunf02G0123000 [Salix dunnii]|uniref:arginase n=1 Tax=Salix dunnii TaxID=1413687 RepID=A0A835N7B8_9ROSI|nr:hypothetical protein SADUNF_Sadunf02G0123000 [Salix dunnii]
MDFGEQPFVMLIGNRGDHGPISSVGKDEWANHSQTSLSKNAAQRSSLPLKRPLLFVRAPIPSPHSIANNCPLPPSVVHPILHTLTLQDMSIIGKRGIHYLRNLKTANIPPELLERGQNRVIDASLTLIRERAKLKGELLRALGGVKASSTLLGVPLGHNSSFLQGPAFAPPRIREAIWCGSTNSSTEEGKELNDPRVLTDVGDVPVQEIRDCGVDDDRLMNVISESVKLVMEEDPLRPLVLGGDHSISFPVVRAVSEKLGGPVDILHLDAHPDIYHCFEGNKYSHASSFARIMEGGYARRLLQVGIRSITKEGREQGKRFGVEQYEMRTFSRDRQLLENLVSPSLPLSLFFSQTRACTHHTCKLGEGVKGVYISVDVDCLDPAFAPGVSHIEPGGLSFRNVLDILQNLQADVVAADVVEFNPQRDTVDGMTAMVAAKLPAGGAPIAEENMDKPVPELFSAAGVSEAKNSICATPRTRMLRTFPRAHIPKSLFFVDH